MARSEGLFENGPADHQSGNWAELRVIMKIQRITALQRKAPSVWYADKGQGPRVVNLQEGRQVPVAAGTFNNALNAFKMI